MNSADVEKEIFGLVDEDYDSVVSLIKIWVSDITKVEPPITVRAGLLALVYFYTMYCNSMLARAVKPGTQVKVQDAIETFEYVCWQYLQRGMLETVGTKHLESLQRENNG